MTCPAFASSCCDHRVDGPLHGGAGELAHAEQLELDLLELFVEVSVACVIRTAP